MQDLDISVDEWAVVFFLTEIELNLIRGSHFWWSFQDGRISGMLEIGFESQN